MGDGQQLWQLRVQQVWPRSFSAIRRNSAGDRKRFARSVPGQNTQERLHTLVIST